MFFNQVHCYGIEKEVPLENSQVELAWYVSGVTGGVGVWSWKVELESGAPQ